MSRVLIVDDSTFMRNTMKFYLESAGHKVFEAVNGLEGVEKFQEVRPDIVAMDIIMNVMDGIKATKAIKLLDSTAKIIIVTAVGQNEIITEAVTNGAKSFIVKPFEGKDFILSIEKTLNLD